MNASTSALKAATAAGGNPLVDPFWRLKNLYSCKREGSGKAIPFRMRQEQEIILRHLHDKPNVPAYIVKARRLGLSTGIGIGMTDHCAWNAGAVGRLIERNMDFASEKMRDIMRFAFNSMPKELVDRFDVKHKDSPQILDPLVSGLDETMRSIIHAGVAARGGDCSWLHVSEWGPIAHKDPERSREIRTGALPAASKGRIVVETTWMGGKGGDLWDLIKPIMERDPDADGELFFFPWHNDPECVRLDKEAITADKEDYFRDLESKLGKTFSNEQKRWYSVTAKKQGIFMTREYPSMLAEAFAAPVEGSIYGKEIGVARAESRVGAWPVDPSCLVHTAFDLGSPANTVAWYFQLVGPMLRIVDCDAGLELTSAQRWAHMLAKPFGNMLGKVLLPHDAASKNATGESPVQSFARAGMRQMAVIPRTHDEWTGINALKELFPLMQFRVPAVEEPLAMLGMYHTRANKAGGTLIDEPVHDQSSHYADGMRYIAEAIRCGMLRFTYGPGLDPANVKPFERIGALYDGTKRRRMPMRVGG